ncbi:MAG: tRNA pseudouridine(38-40) synthase TruA [candidate division KSB1 bacterium]|nr:tRNA pseudouridine(38-40) synthase TruA [candidate division KSB1 bacterium]
MTAQIFAVGKFQPNDRTVQQELERSLSLLTGETIKTTAAGRTDSGVHACGQVVSIKTDSSLPLSAFVRGGNSRLPRDVRIVCAEPAADDFNARYSALRRHYRYYITTRQRALGRRYAWYYWHSLNANRLQQAAGCILGPRDFKSFCQKNAAVNHYMCHVYKARWFILDGYICFDICANRFLHNMVRSLVGTMVEIGAGKQSVDHITEILDAKDRSSAGPTAPALGLFLIKVDYNQERDK